VRSAVRGRLTAQAARVLQPGEQVQAVIWAQTLNPRLVPITPLRMLVGRGNPFRVIVATDRRLLLCLGGRWTRKLLPEVLAELPRATVIGPARGYWHRTDAFGERLYVQCSSHDEIAKADAAVHAR
jgi:hypothetical protein